jgi:tripartite-type tricarboxylate transporter receptor subunit TctC
LSPQQPARTSTAPYARLNYASAGNGTPAHLSGVMLGNKAGVDIKHIVHTALAAIVEDPAFAARMAAAGIDVDVASPDVFAAFTRSEVQRFRQLVALAGAMVE